MKKSATDVKYGLKAFTLIELLVVIAIISMLVGILLPSLNKARERAKDVACLATLKGIGVGWQMYWTQNEQCIPVSPPMPENIDTDDSIVVALCDYVSATRAWRCPSGKGDDKFESTGTSYEYLGGYVMKIDESKLSYVLPYIIRTIDHDPASYPIFTDADEYHTKTSKNIEGKMASYHDGHAEELNMKTAEDVIVPILEDI